jgi:hypothetical protein
MANVFKQRKHLFVDPKVQGGLIARVVLYWFICLVTIAMILLCWRIITGPARVFYTHFDAMWFHYGPVFVTSLLLLPLVILDIIQFSNRFVGPMLRLKRSMRQLARGEEVAPLEFRNSDFWQDVAVDFNALRERIQASATPKVDSEKADQSELIAAEMP